MRKIFFAFRQCRRAARLCKSGIPERNQLFFLPPLTTAMPKSCCRHSNCNASSYVRGWRQSPFEAKTRQPRRYRLIPMNRREIVRENKIREGHSQLFADVTGMAKMYSRPDSRFLGLRRRIGKTREVLAESRHQG